MLGLVIILRGYPPGSDMIMTHARPLPLSSIDLVWREGEPIAEELFLFCGGLPRPLTLEPHAALAPRPMKLSNAYYTDNADWRSGCVSTSLAVPKKLGDGATMS